MLHLFADHSEQSCTSLSCLTLTQSPPCPPSCPPHGYLVDETFLTGWLLALLASLLPVHAWIVDGQTVFLLYSLSILQNADVMQGH